MKKFLVLFIAVLLGLSMSAAAQDEKKEQGDRLSGTVKFVDAKAMSVEIMMSKQTGVVRKLTYDSATKVMLGDKPGAAADIKEGMRIVAIGKFEGVILKATSIRVRYQ